MAMDSTMQIRMDGQVKANVEELYRNLGTSFAEAVRIFAQQSLLAGGFPFQPTLKTWETMSEGEIDAKLSAGEADSKAERVYTIEEVNAMMDEKFRHGERIVLNHVHPDSGEVDDLNGK